MSPATKDVTTQHIFCASCYTTNRVPVTKLDGQHELRCGKCKHDLLEPKPIEVSSNQFSQFIEQTDLPVVVDFWAPWCAPCRAMAPQFEESASLMPLVRHLKVDTQAHPETAQQFGIRSIPTLVLFSNGVELDRRSGVLTSANLVDWVSVHFQSLS